MNGYKLSIDIGGTFIDVVVFDFATRTLTAFKLSTTPQDPAKGVVDAIGRLDVAAGEIIEFIHGTTLGLNAVLERKLARTGLITTQGFRDVLELGRRTRPQAYGMSGRFTPVIPRDLRLEVPERMDARGRVLTPLDEAAFRAALEGLLAAGCEALVIHFLHAYANPAHELRALQIAAEAWPNAHVTAGHQLLSESREYERGVTAAVNAAVQPLLERYIARLRDELSAFALDEVRAYDAVIDEGPAHSGMSAVIDVVARRRPGPGPG